MIKKVHTLLLGTINVIINSFYVILSVTWLFNLCTKDRFFILLLFFKENIQRTTFIFFEKHKGPLKYNNKVTNIVLTYLSHFLSQPKKKKKKNLFCVIYFKNTAIKDRETFFLKKKIVNETI